MYYIIGGDNIVESCGKKPTQEELQQWADDIDDEVYVIRGEHAGMSAMPQSVVDAFVAFLCEYSKDQ